LAVLQGLKLCYIIKFAGMNFYVRTIHTYTVSCQL